MWRKVVVAVFALFLLPCAGLTEAHDGEDLFPAWDEYMVDLESMGLEVRDHLIVIDDPYAGEDLMSSLGMEIDRGEGEVVDGDLVLLHQVTEAFSIYRFGERIASFAGTYKIFMEGRDWETPLEDLDGYHYYIVWMKGTGMLTEKGDDLGFYIERVGVESSCAKKEADLSSAWGEATGYDYAGISNWSPSTEEDTGSSRTVTASLGFSVSGGGSVPVGGSGGISESWTLYEGRVSPTVDPTFLSGDMEGAVYSSLNYESSHGRRKGTQSIVSGAEYRIRAGLDSGPNFFVPSAMMGNAEVIGGTTEPDGDNIRAAGMLEVEWLL